MEKIPVYLLILAVMALPVLIQRRVFRPKGIKQDLTGHAVVVSRRVDQGNGYVSGPFSRWKYLVTFDLGSARLELEASEVDYARLKEGTEGQLVWRYEYLVSFIPDKS